MPNETNGVNNAINCYIEAVQFSASFATSLFTSFWRNLCIFHPVLWTLVNTSPDRSAVLVLPVINLTYCSCTCIHQIQQIKQEIWPESDLARFLKNGQIRDLPEPKSGTTLHTTHTLWPLFPELLPKNKPLNIIMIQNFWYIKNSHLFTSKSSHMCNINENIGPTENLSPGRIYKMPVKFLDIHYDIQVSQKLINLEKV